MKNIKLIKFIIMVITGAVILTGFYIFLRVKDNKNMKKESSQEVGSDQVTIAEKTSQETITLEETEEITMDTVKESLFLDVTYPEEFPEAEPEAEIYSDIDAVEIKIYFVNMDTIDSSKLLPLTAWEKLSKSTQIYLNRYHVDVMEIQAVENSIVKEGDIISFYATFPDIQNSSFKISYDTSKQQFDYELSK